MYRSSSHLSGIDMDRLWMIARGLFPKETAKAESWVTSEAKRLGVQYAQQKVQEAAVNPIVWAAVGLGALGLVFGLMRR